MKEKLHNLIIENKTELVIEKLLSLTKGYSYLYEEVMQLSARFHQNEKQRRLNLVENSEINIENNKIREALLSIISSLPNNRLNVGVLKLEKPTNWLKIGLVILLLGSIFCIVVFIWKNSLNATIISTDKNVLPNTDKKNKIDTISKDTVKHKKEQFAEIPAKVFKNRDIPNPKEESLIKNNPKNKDIVTPIAEKPIITDAQLSIECKTDKGNQNLFYKEGETMRLYLKVTRPCYLRVFYRLADGQIILFENDRQISSNDIGKFIEIGDGYEAEAPFGEESLYAFAQNMPFPALKTKEVDGYIIVTDGLPDALNKTKAFRKKELFAETTLKITTQK